MPAGISFDTAGGKINNASAALLREWVQSLATEKDELGGWRYSIKDIHAAVGHDLLAYSTVRFWVAAARELVPGAEDADTGGKPVDTGGKPVLERDAVVGWRPPLRGAPGPWTLREYLDSHRMPAGISFETAGGRISNAAAVLLREWVYSIATEKNELGRWRYSSKDIHAAAGHDLLVYSTVRRWVADAREPVPGVEDADTGGKPVLERDAVVGWRPPLPGAPGPRTLREYLDSHRMPAGISFDTASGKINHAAMVLLREWVYSIATEKNELGRWRYSSKDIHAAAGQDLLGERTVRVWVADARELARGAEDADTGGKPALERDAVVGWRPPLLGAPGPRTLQEYLDSRRMLAGISFEKTNGKINNAAAALLREWVYSIATEKNELGRWRYSSKDIHAAAGHDLLAYSTVGVWIADARELARGAEDTGGKPALERDAMVGWRPPLPGAPGPRTLHEYLDNHRMPAGISFDTAGGKLSNAAMVLLREWVQSLATEKNELGRWRYSSKDIHAAAGQDLLVYSTVRRWVADAREPVPGVEDADTGGKPVLERDAVVGWRPPLPGAPGPRTLREYLDSHRMPEKICFEKTNGKINNAAAALLREWVYSIATEKNELGGRRYSGKDIHVAAGQDLLGERTVRVWIADARELARGAEDTGGKPALERDAMVGWRPPLPGAPGPRTLHEYLDNHRMPAGISFDTAGGKINNAAAALLREWVQSLATEKDELGGWRYSIKDIHAAVGHDLLVYSTVRSWVADARELVPGAEDTDTGGKPALERDAMVGWRPPLPGAPGPRTLHEYLDSHRMPAGISFGKANGKINNASAALLREWGQSLATEKDELGEWRYSIKDIHAAAGHDLLAYSTLRTWVTDVRRQRGGQQERVPGGFGSVSFGGGGRPMIVQTGRLADESGGSAFAGRVELQRRPLGEALSLVPEWVMEWWPDSSPGAPSTLLEFLVANEHMLPEDVSPVPDENGVLQGTVLIFVRAWFLNALEIGVEENGWIDSDDVADLMELVSEWPVTGLLPGGEDLFSVPASLLQAAPGSSAVSSEIRAEAQASMALGRQKSRARVEESDHDVEMEVPVVDASPQEMMPGGQSGAGEPARGRDLEDRVRVRAHDAGVAPAGEVSGSVPAGAESARRVLDQGREETVWGESGLEVGEETYMVRAVRHRVEPFAGMDDLFPARDRRDPSRADEPYADENGDVHPAVKRGADRITAKMAEGMAMLRGIAEDPDDPRLPAELATKMPAVQQFLRIKVAEELKRLVLGEPLLSPRLVVGPVLPEHVLNHDQGLANGKELGVRLSDAEAALPGNPALAGSRIDVKGLYMGASLRTPGSQEEWKEKYRQAPNYTFATRSRGANITHIAGEGMTNSVGFVNAPTVPDAYPPEINHGAVNSLLIPFEVTMPNKRGKDVEDTFIALIVLDNAYDSSDNPHHVLWAEYSHEFFSGLSVVVKEEPE
ncbi:hypothetical protein [Amycolatopsis decaplanina]|uniref:Uncharacterized protein n=1 Tax=Amycolatopsis decaplanina DSM 44594 TaxID=1284240 RepID=M2ZZB6_9PSEU|nr:hypothetical protein [Amycolatopsis decaplanina]EME65644.1 hypothetical protein H074_00072 [Amycolatopsis decaplanina DSM 44594]